MAIGERGQVVGRAQGFGMAVAGLGIALVAETALFRNRLENMALSLSLASCSSISSLGSSNLEL